MDRPGAPTRRCNEACNFRQPVNAERGRRAGRHAGRQRRKRAAVDCTAAQGVAVAVLGQYRDGERTKAAIAEQRKFGAPLKMLRDGLT